MFSCNHTAGLGRNPVRVGERSGPEPRVARSSQPWAGGRNPVGILNDQRQSSATREQDASSATAELPAPPRVLPARSSCRRSELWRGERGERDLVNLICCESQRII